MMLKAALNLIQSIRVYHRHTNRPMTMEYRCINLKFYFLILLSAMIILVVYLCKSSFAISATYIKSEVIGAKQDQTKNTISLPDNRRTPKATVTGNVAEDDAVLIKDRTKADKIKVLKPDPKTVDHGANIACIHTNPALNTYEFNSETDLDTFDGYCAVKDNRTTFEINFNIERAFTIRAFSPKFQTQKKERVIKKAPNAVNLIPKKFHFIWSGEIIPDRFAENIKRYRKLHPNWEIHFWTIKYGRQLIKKLEPHILSAYDGYFSDTIRADVLRYVLMYHYGGAYLDIDINPQIPFDNLTLVDDCLLGPEPLEHAYFVLPKLRSILSNAILFCKPKHTFYRYVIDRLPAFKHVQGFIGVAGPLFLTQNFNSFIEQMLRSNTSVKIQDHETRISILPHHYFESLLQAFVIPELKKVCGPVLPHVDYFMTNCQSETTIPSKCVSLVHAVNNTKEVDNLLIGVCVEWISHGQNNRDIFQSDRYALHQHAAVREALGSLKYLQRNNMTRLMVVPDAIVHV